MVGLTIGEMTYFINFLLESHFSKLLLLPLVRGIVAMMHMFSLMWHIDYIKASPFSYLLHDSFFFKLTTDCSVNYIWYININ